MRDPGATEVAQGAIRVAREAMQLEVLGSLELSTTDPPDPERQTHIPDGAIVVDRGKTS